MYCLAVMAAVGELSVTPSNESPQFSLQFAGFDTSIASEAGVGISEWATLPSLSTVHF
jgi:hypothetical protein